MFQNPWSRHRPGSLGLLQGIRGLFGQFGAISQAFRNYLYNTPSGLQVTNPVPFPSTVSVFALNASQAADVGVVMGAQEITSATTRADINRPGGVYGVSYATPAAGVAVGRVRGGDFDGVFNGAGSAAECLGSLHYAEIDAGTVTTLAAIKTVGPFRSAGTLTNNYGVWVSQLQASAATTQVGVQVDSIGGSNAFAIRTSGSDPIQIPGVIQGTAAILSPSAAISSTTTIDSAGSLIQVQGTGGTWGSSQIALGANTKGLGLSLVKTRGASAATNTIVVNGDQLGLVWAYGNDGAAYQESSGISFEVDGSPAANNVPGRIKFLTVSTGQFLNTVGTWDSSGRLGIGVTPAHYLDILAGTATIAQIRLASSTVLTSATAGCIEFDGKALYQTSVASSRQIVDAEQVQALSGSRTFSNNTSAQAIFNASANGAITLAASTSYEFEMVVGANTFSSSAHTLNLGFGGTATFTSIGYYFASSPGPNALASCSSGYIQVATATAVTATGITTQGLSLYVRGIMRINASGTVIPQLTQVTASAAAVVLANSFFRCWPIGSDTVTNVGNWS